MAIRGSLTMECDRPKCHAEMVLEGEDFSAEIPRAKLLLSYIVDEWKLDDDGNLWCPQCRDEAENHRDEAYERAAARSRNCDFADNPRHPGRDWT